MATETLSVTETLAALQPAALPLAGRRALITGGARGMGAAHARSLAARGASLAVVDLDAGEVDATAAEVEAIALSAVDGSDVPAPTVTAIAADITTRSSAEAIIAEAAATLGGLDILVHNAGRMFSMQGLAETDDADFRAMFAVNVDAPLFLTRAALPYLRASEHARVIFINSQWGQVADGHSYAYMSAKSAQLGLMKALASEFVSERILVNAITPGAIATRMVPAQNEPAEIAAIPLGRLGRPEEIAEAVAFLASDSAAFITGQVIPVNGGALIVGI